MGAALLVAAVAGIIILPRPLLRDLRKGARETFVLCAISAFPLFTLTFSVPSCMVEYRDSPYGEVRDQLWLVDDLSWEQESSFSVHGR